MKLLALDLSTKQSGWALGPMSKPYPEAWGSIAPPPKLHRPSRIEKTVAGLAPLLLDPVVTRVVAEDIGVAPFKRKDGTKGDANFKTALVLAELRGAVQFVLWRKRGIELELANLSTVKAELNLHKTFALKGLPTKEDLRIVFDRMGMETKNDDESDAIAVWIATRMRGDIRWK